MALVIALVLGSVLLQRCQIEMSHLQQCALVFELLLLLSDFFYMTVVKLWLLVPFN